MPYTTLKQYGNHTASFKFIGQDENQQFLNEEEKEFHSILKKQATVLKVNELQFLNNKQKCRSLIDNLLLEYDLFQNLGTDLKNLSTLKVLGDENEKDNQKLNISEQYKFIEYDDNLSLNMKSKIIFLQLQNKKLKMKEKILKNKYQKQVLKTKMIPNFEKEKNIKQKQLLEIELQLLQQIKNLTSQLEELRNNFQSLTEKKQRVFSNITSKKNSKIQGKKINKLKIMKYLLEKTQNTSTPEEFQSLLLNIQKNYQF